MGCFAIIRDPEEPDFSVTACHLNFWSLSGLFGRRVFLWDVGLTIEAAEDKTNKGLSKISLLLPFGTEPGAFEDLSQEILDQTIARLLFGKSVTVNGKIIEYSGGTNRLRVVPVIKATIDEDFEKDKGLRRANLSLWTIEFASKIRAAQKSYVRVRFRMRTLGRNWVWMRSKRGALIDIRVADIREVVMPSEAGATLEAYGERLVPIQTLRAFVIVPAHLLFRATSPQLHYMRLFEGRVWEKYLGRAVDIWRSEKLMIYQWRSDAVIDTKDNATDPFRAFLVLSRESGLLSFVNHILIAALVVFGVLFILHPEYAKEGARAVANIADKFGYPIGGATVLLILAWLLKNFGPLRKGLSKAWSVFRSLENWIFRLRSKIDI